VNNRKLTPKPARKLRQQPFTRSHHRASMRGRTATLSGNLAGEPTIRRP
jgi:hypothetical protein